MEYTGAFVAVLLLLMTILGLAVIPRGGPPEDKP